MNETHRAISLKIAFLVLLLVPVLMVLIAVSGYGPGLSSDGVHYYAAANNLSIGKGLTDYQGLPLVDWPPLLSVLLASLKRIIGLDTLQLALGINLLAYLGIFWGAFQLTKESRLQRSFWPATMLFIVAFSSSLMGLSSNLGSDVLFMALTLAFLIWLMRYYTSHSRNQLVVAALFVAAACLLRYIGFALIVVGMVAIGISYWRTWRKAITDVVIFGAISSIPAAAWVIGVNYAATGTLVGKRNLAAILPFENLAYSISRIVHWFLPSAITKQPYFLYLLIGIMAFVVLLSKRAEWKSLFRALFGDSKIVLVLFLFVYLFFVVFTTFTLDHFEPYDDRYQLPLLFPILIFVFTFLEVLIIPKLGRFALPSLAVVFLLFLGFHGFLSYRFVSQSVKEGVIYYNLYNTKTSNESEFVGFLQSFDYENGLSLYANDPEALYVYTLRETRASLSAPEGVYDLRFYLLTEIKRWPDQSRAYLVWFTRYFNQNYVTPHRLSLVTDLQPLFSEKEGAFYLITPKPTQ